MSETRPLPVSIRARELRGLAAAIVVLAVLLLAPATAGALQVAVTMPDSSTVGDTGVTARVTLTNTSNGAATICNQGDCAGPSEGIIAIPSCASAATPAPTCSGTDPGVFSFSPTATIVAGTCGTNNLVMSFDVVEDAVQGKLRLAPNAGAARAVVTLAGSGKAGSSCDIPLTFSVVKLPVDVNGDLPGAQTYSSASAQATLQTGGEDPGQPGRTVTTVLPRTPPPPPPIVVLPPPPLTPPLPPPPRLPPPPAPAGLDHFKCYEAVQPNFRQRSVRTRDQFGERTTRVLRTRQLCNPVSKNEGRIVNPRAHLVCYETRDRNPDFKQRVVVVTNQFGQRKLTVLRPNRLCVPSLKRRGTVAPAGGNPERVLDHFRCYDVKAQPASRAVTLKDQFGVTPSKVLEVIRLCNPVRKNNTPVRNAKAHLVCYSIRDARTLRIPAIRVRNQFGRAALRVRAAQTLCLPSFKQVIQTEAVSAAPPGLDHFKCYESEQPQFQPRNVGLRDQFGQFEAQVLEPRQLCNPVSKNAGKVLNKHAHLVCYETRDLGIVPFQPRQVLVSNQFGVRQLSATAPVALCVPSLKRKGAGAAPTGPNPTLVLDHFRCYDVKSLTASKLVKLVDQFKTTKTKVVQLVRLCNPVRKNNEPVRRPKAHLVCYTISEPPFQPLAVTVRNQFGVAGLRVRKPQMLCLPSLKKLVTAAGVDITPANPG